MSETGSEQGRDLDPSKALQESLETQGLFVRINQGVREAGGGYDYVYEAIVLSKAEVAEAIARANSYEGVQITDASQLKWEDVKDRPEVHEGEDRLDSLQGAMAKFFDT